MLTKKLGADRAAVDEKALDDKAGVVDEKRRKDGVMVD